MTVGTPISAILKRIRDMPTQPRPRPGERCELCSDPVADEHGHVVDLETRALMCACRPCYLAFEPEGAGGTRFRAVLDHVMAVPDFAVSDAQWESLQIPVSVAFFLLNSSLGRVVAFYPSPAGATESLLPLDAWDQIVLANPALAAMRADVEATLVRRISRDEVECFVVPIDVCYELVGELRMLWRGFDGGTEAHAAIDATFERIRDRA